MMDRRELLKLGAGEMAAGFASGRATAAEDVAETVVRWGVQALEQIACRCGVALKGHGFSRAVSSIKSTRPLGPEGRISPTGPKSRVFPQPL
jgi:hypothetical protein